MKNPSTPNPRIAKMTFASVYPMYVKKIEKKGRTEEELHQVIAWLTGFDDEKLEELITENATFEIFFQQASLNPNAHLITGVICGYRVEEIADPLTQQVRYWISWWMSWRRAGRWRRFCAARKVVVSFVSSQYRRRSVMRKVVVLEHITLDGVIQAPGGPDEDTRGGFTYGGWIAPYSDAMLGAALRRQMGLPFDLLLGRVTYDIWAPYWPHHGDIWPGVNPATKYVASRTLTSGAWQPTVILNGDVAEQVARIKQQPGPDLHVWGSGDLLQTLMQHDLVDTFWLMIYPLTLGAGKRLFAEGAIPAAFVVTESIVSSSGVIVVNYERAGAVTTGSL